MWCQLQTELVSCPHVRSWSCTGPSAGTRWSARSCRSQTFLYSASFCLPALLQHQCLKTGHKTVVYLLLVIYLNCVICFLCETYLLTVNCLLDQDLGMAQCQRISQSSEICLCLELDYEIFLCLEHDYETCLCLQLDFVICLHSVIYQPVVVY